MARWFRKVFTAGENDQAGLIMDACDHYEREYEHVKTFIHDRTQSVAAAEASISGWMEICAGACQDMETIMDYLETKEAKEKLKHIRHYHNAYPKDFQTGWWRSMRMRNKASKISACFATTARMFATSTLLERRHWTACSISLGISRN
jgi:GH24 family phage-related lysozyme (muramidase)